MKKITLLTGICLMFLFGSLQAQKAGESNEKSPVGGNGNAITITLEAQADNVEDVMEEKFKKLKGKKEKGFEAFKGQIFEPISSDMLDIYYRVEKVGGDKCKVIIFLSKGYDNWLTGQQDGSEVQNTKKMLDEMVAEVRKYELQLAIDAQTKVLEDELKEQEKLVKELEKLVKDKEKLEEELAENKEDQETNKKTQEEQKKKIEEEKKLLDELQKRLGQVK